MRRKLFLDVLDGVLLGDGSLLRDVLRVVLVLRLLRLSQESLHHGQGVDECFVGWPRSTLDMIVYFFADLNQVCEVFAELVS